MVHTPHNDEAHPPVTAAEAISFSIEQPLPRFVGHQVLPNPTVTSRAYLIYLLLLLLKSNDHKGY